MCKPLFLITASPSTGPDNITKGVFLCMLALGRFGYSESTRPIPDENGDTLPSLRFVGSEREGSTHQSP